MRDEKDVREALERLSESMNDPSSPLHGLDDEGQQKLMDLMADYKELKKLEDVARAGGQGAAKAAEVLNKRMSEFLDKHKMDIDTEVPLATFATLARDTFLTFFEGRSSDEWKTVGAWIKQFERHLRDVRKGSIPCPQVRQR